MILSRYVLSHTSGRNDSIRHTDLVCGQGTCKFHLQARFVRRFISQFELPCSQITAGVIASTARRERVKLNQINPLKINLVGFSTPWYPNLGARGAFRLVDTPMLSTPNSQLKT